jgi:hypothetical protein
MESPPAEMPSALTIQKPVLAQATLHRQLSSSENPQPAEVTMTVRLPEAWLKHPAAGQSPATTDSTLAAPQQSPALNHHQPASHSFYQPATLPISALRHDSENKFRTEPDEFDFQKMPRSERPVQEHCLTAA